MDDLFPYYKRDEWAKYNDTKYVCSRHHKSGEFVPATNERIKNSFDGLCFSYLCDECLEWFMDVDIQTKVRDQRIKVFEEFLEQEDKRGGSQ